MTIQEALQNILQAVFGRDIRQSIHDGIDAINKESKADMAAKQEVIDTYTTKQDLLDQKYNTLLDELSKSDPSLAEVVDARLGGNSKEYGSLKERLDAIFRGTETEIETGASLADYIVSNLNQLRSTDGELMNLTTADKTNLVAAINTLVAKDKDLSAKDNELQTNINNANTMINQLSTTHSTDKISMSNRITANEREISSLQRAVGTLQQDIDKIKAKIGM